MNRRMLTLILAAAPAFAADLPSPEAIMDRYIEATGGKKAYAARTSEITHGTIEAAGLGLTGTMTNYKAAPGEYYSSLEIVGLGKTEMGVTGGVAWENSTLLGPRIKTGEERAEALRDAAFDSTVGWRKLYPKAETAGVETIDGEECFKVVMSPLEGQPLIRYFQKKSGLEVKTTTIGVTQLGEIPIELAVSEYKDFGGLLTPAKVRQKAGGQDLTITVLSVEVNPKIPADRFALPPEVKALADNPNIQRTDHVLLPGVTAPVDKAAAGK